MMQIENYIQVEEIYLVLRIVNVFYKLCVYDDLWVQIF